MKDFFHTHLRRRKICEYKDNLCKIKLANGLYLDKWCNDIPELCPFYIERKSQEEATARGLERTLNNLRIGL